MEKENIIETYYRLITSQNRELFEVFRALLQEYNEKYNLTAITQERDILYKHFIDSALGESFFEKNAKVAEIGSGAGFPSIPLKIIRPDLSFDLYESVGKKCDFLHVVVDKLGLTKMNIYNIRAEEAVKNNTVRERYDHATARAVARMNTLCEYCLPFVRVGGSFIAYKSGDVTEIEEANNACKLLGGEIKRIEKYKLPYEYGERSIAVVKKTKSTPLKYPRGQGKERKNPL